MFYQKLRISVSNPTDVWVCRCGFLAGLIFNVLSKLKELSKMRVSVIVSESGLHQGQLGPSSAACQIITLG